ncbi:septation protein SpoVG family protein [Candidatus Omnitrophota bacterium]
MEGNKGLFVAMPSRRMKQPCPKCNHRNVLRSRYCNNCGTSMDGTTTQPQDGSSRQNEHKDIAHPITLECREYIQKLVLEAYENQKDGSVAHDEHSSVNHDLDEIE